MLMMAAADFPRTLPQGRGLDYRRFIRSKNAARAPVGARKSRRRETISYLYGEREVSRRHFLTQPGMFSSFPRVAFVVVEYHCMQTIDVVLSASFAQRPTCYPVVYVFLVVPVIPYSLEALHSSVVVDFDSIVLVLKFASAPVFPSKR